MIQERFVLMMLRRRSLISSDDDDRIERYGDNLFVRGIVLVSFVEKSKVTTEVIKSILRLSQLYRTIDCPNIIIHANAITPDAKHALESKCVRFETFTFDEMAFDLIEAVPHHSLVKDFDKSNTNDWRKYPILSIKDIVARYYAFRKDDIVRIVLEDETVTYRRCA